MHNPTVILADELFRASKSILCSDGKTLEEQLCEQLGMSSNLFIEGAHKTCSIDEFVQDNVTLQCPKENYQFVDHPCVVAFIILAQSEASGGASKKLISDRHYATLKLCSFSNGNAEYFFMDALASQNGSKTAGHWVSAAKVMQSKEYTLHTIGYMPVDVYQRLSMDLTDVRHITDHRIQSWGTKIMSNKNGPLSVATCPFDAVLAALSLFQWECLLFHNGTAFLQDKRDYLDVASNAQAILLQLSDLTNNPLDQLRDQTMQHMYVTNELYENAVLKEEGYFSAALVLETLLTQAAGTWRNMLTRSDYAKKMKLDKKVLVPVRELTSWLPATGFEASDRAFNCLVTFISLVMLDCVGHGNQMDPAGNILPLPMFQGCIDLCKLLLKDLKWFGKRKYPLLMIENLLKAFTPGECNGNISVLKHWFFVILQCIGCGEGYTSLSACEGKPATEFLHQFAYVYPSAANSTGEMRARVQRCMDFLTCVCGRIERGYERVLHRCIRIKDEDSKLMPPPPKKQQDTASPPPKKQQDTASPTPPPVKQPRTSFQTPPTKQPSPSPRTPPTTQAPHSQVKGMPEKAPIVPQLTGVDYVSKRQKFMQDIASFFLMATYVFMSEEDSNAAICKDLQGELGSDALMIY